MTRRYIIGFALVLLLLVGAFYQHQLYIAKAATSASVPMVQDVDATLIATAVSGNTTWMGPPVPFDPLLGVRNGTGPVPRVENIVLRSGQTLSAALSATGASTAAVHGAIDSLQGLIDFRHLSPGDRIKARFNDSNNLVALDISHGFTQQARTRYLQDAWAAERVDISIDTVMAEVSGEVHSSLWEALMGAGEDPRLVQALVDIFAYDIDFYSEVHPQDSFCLLVEKRYANGQFVEYGAITAAEFVTDGLPHRAFMHRYTDGSAAYFDETGRSMRKQLLKSPLRYGPVTSGFGARRHPILGYTRNHNGVDYGVPTGTPVWSVGDGRVVKAGSSSGFGRMVEVLHSNGWVSQYAHLSRINVHVGQRLQQKDIVGHVGQTGLATGPHLHYGLKKNGHYVNPLQQHFERSKPLLGNDLSDFKTHVAVLLNELNKVKIAQEQSKQTPQKG